MGYICGRLIELLADVRPYMGWYWLLAVAGGVVTAAGVPWAFVAAFRGSVRWPRWLLPSVLIVYVIALIVGMQYYLGLRFTPPATAPAVLPPPPFGFVLKIAGLSAMAFTFVAITLLLLACLVAVIAPGPIQRWARAWRHRHPRRARTARHSGPVDERFPARLRLEGPDGQAGRWLRGAIRVRPGSLLWEPARGVRAAPAELTSATIVPGGAGPDGASGRGVTVDTPTGRIQLDCGASLLALLQRSATDLANRRLPPGSRGCEGYSITAGTEGERAGREVRRFRYRPRRDRHAVRPDARQRSAHPRARELSWRRGGGGVQGPLSLPQAALTTVPGVAVLLAGRGHDRLRLTAPAPNHRHTSRPCADLLYAISTCCTCRPRPTYPYRDISDANFVIAYG
jgi:hypothetical protein